MLPLSLIAQVFAIWTGLAAVTALSVGAGLGAMSAVPTPAPIPRRRRAPEAACRENTERIGCGAG
jgi:hypothetical protein